jgi:hypothetical protein
MRIQRSSRPVQRYGPFSLAGLGYTGTTTGSGDVHFQQDYLVLVKIQAHFTKITAQKSAKRWCYLRVIVGVHVLQSICTVALVQSRVKMPLFGAVSVHNSVG